MLPLSLELWELFSLGIPVAVVLLPEVKLHYVFDLQPDGVRLTWLKVKRRVRQSRHEGLEVGIPLGSNTDIFSSHLGPLFPF